MFFDELNLSTDELFECIKGYVEGLVTSTDEADAVIDYVDNNFDAKARIVDRIIADERMDKIIKDAWECFLEDYPACYQCGRRLLDVDEDFTTVDGNDYCEDCFDEHTVECSKCLRSFDKNSPYYNSVEFPFCDDCLVDIAGFIEQEVPPDFRDEINLGFLEEEYPTEFENFVQYVKDHAVPIGGKQAMVDGYLLHLKKCVNKSIEVLDDSGSAGETTIRRLALLAISRFRAGKYTETRTLWQAAQYFEKSLPEQEQGTLMKYYKREVDPIEGITPFTSDDVVAFTSVVSME